MARTDSVSIHIRTDAIKDSLDTAERIHKIRKGTKRRPRCRGCGRQAKLVKGDKSLQYCFKGPECEDYFMTKAR